MSGDTEWRWADPAGQQRLVRTDELLAALASGVLAPNTPVWRSGWKNWKPAFEVPELTSSALASANGVVPNIPPPPLFMVAVQHDYEDKSVPQTRPAPGTEPPPPPPYVPYTVAAPSQGPVPPSSAASSAASTGAGAGTLAQPPTMAGLGALPLPPALAENEAPAPRTQPLRSSVADDAGWEATKLSSENAIPAVPPQEAAAPEMRETPHMNTEAKPAIDLTALSPAQASHLRAPVSHPTMHGIPALSEPSLPPPPPLRPSALPTAQATEGSMGLSPSYAPRPSSFTGSSPLVSSRPPPPLKKRPTLLLYGGAPQDGPDASSSGNGEHPSINVPAPGAQAPKAVTQAPPWTEDWGNLDPTIPKPAPAHLPPMRPIADSIEEITGAVLLPPEETSASTAQKEQKIEDLSASHVIPEDGASTPATVDMEAVTIAGKPSPLPLPSTTDERTDSEGPPQEAFPAVPPPSPSLRLVHDLSEIWNHPKKRWVLAGSAAAALIVILGGIGLLVRLFSGSPADSAVHEAPVAPVPPPDVPSVPAAPAEPAKAASNAAVVSEPEAVGPSSTPCGIAGAPRVIAPKAQIRVGVEAAASENHLALGFATGDKDGFGVALESPSLVALGTAKQHAHESIRHLVPIAGAGKSVSIVADIERKTDKIAGARTLGGNGSFVLGSADGKLVWGAHASDAPHALWPLENDGPAEAIRSVGLDGGGYAVAFRQGAAVYLGVLNADKTPNGDLVRVAGLGPQIGSPALGASGKSIVMAWADRAAATDPWGVRLLEWKRGEPPGQARSFSIPPGGLGEQAMSPGLAGLSGGRFLLAWTEGPVASHQVRAETLGAAGNVLGAALTVSADGVNAGQGQVAVLPDGRGLVVYMASPAGSTAEVVATPIACPPSPM